MEEKKIEIKANVKITSKQLYKFNLYHCFCNSTNGAFGVILGLLCLIYGIAFKDYLNSSTSVMAVMLGVIFLIYNPVSLFVRSKSRYMSNDALNKPIEYCFDEKGFIISQGELSEDMEWADLYKVVETDECLYFFFTKMHANIVPKEALGESIDTIYKLINENIKGKKNKLKKENKVC